MILRQGRPRRRPTHKLYVGIGIDAVRDALADTIGAAEAAETPRRSRLL